MPRWGSPQNHTPSQLHKGQGTAKDMLLIPHALWPVWGMRRVQATQIDVHHMHAPWLKQIHALIPKLC